MLVISSREFRDKQKTYLDKADEGAEILIMRGKNKSYKIVPISANDTLMSEKDFFAKIDKSLAEIQAGKSTRIETKLGLTTFLDSL